MLSRREVLVGPVALSPIGLYERFLDITRKVDTASPHNGSALSLRASPDNGSALMLSSVGAETLSALPRFINEYL